MLYYCLWLEVTPIFCICTTEVLDNGELQIPFQLCTQLMSSSGLAWAIVGVSTPCKLVNAPHQDLHFEELTAIPFVAHP